MWQLKSITSQSTDGEVGTFQRLKVHLEMFVKLTGGHFSIFFFCHSTVFFSIFCICLFLDAIASPSTYPCQSVSQSVSQLVIDSFRLEIAIASHIRACFVCLHISYQRQHWGEISCYDSCEFCDSMSSCDFSSCYDDTVFTDTLIQKVISSLKCFEEIIAPYS